MNSRKCKISYTEVRNPFKERYLKPKITISGKWLNEIGFTIGEDLLIEVKKNSLVIKKASK